MDRESALLAAASRRSSERLDAARWFVLRAQAGDVETLRSWQGREQDELVYRVVQRGLTRAEELQARAELEDADTSDASVSSAEIRRQTIAMLLHELSPAVGDLDLLVAAGNDVEVDRLSPVLDQFQLVLDSFDELRLAAETPRTEEINLTDVATGAVRSVLTQFPHAVLAGDGAGSMDAEKDEVKQPQLLKAEITEILFARHDPVVTYGSPALLNLVIRNGVRNAIEACEVLPPGVERRVTVSWAATDIDAWVSIVDTGPGLPLEKTGLWEPGRSTKLGTSHRGMGLTIVEQAAESIRGDVELVNRDAGGARLELRWTTGGHP